MNLSIYNLILLYTRTTEVGGRRLEEVLTRFVDQVKEIFMNSSRAARIQARMEVLRGLLTRSKKIFMNSSRRSESERASGRPGGRPNDVVEMINPADAHRDERTLN